MTRSSILLDTCTLINLLASGEFDEILRSAGSNFEICTAVRKESLYLRLDDPEAEALEQIEIEIYIQSGTLRECGVENENEEVLYVDYASQLDDGEAMSLALAIARDFVLATDDRKARRMFLEAVGAPERLMSTLDLIRIWSERGAVSPDRLQIALCRIKQRAKFIPSPNDPNFQWWCDLCP